MTSSITLPINIVAKIGEDLPLNNDFYDIQNLNHLYHNFPLFDFIAKRKIDDKYVLFSAKGRNAFSKNGDLNKYYHILTKDKTDENSSQTTARKITKVIQLLKNINIIVDINNITFGFIICPIKYGSELKYYWGYFSDIKNNINLENLKNGNCGFLSVPVTPEKLETYNIFGVQSWDYIKTKYL